MARSWSSKTLQELRSAQIGDDRPFCELVPWMFTTRNQSIVVNKDGAIMACFEFEGLDTDSSTDAEVDVLSAHLENAMRLFQHYPVVYWWQVHRRVSTKWPRASFQNLAAKKLDQMRKTAMTVKPQYSNQHVLTILLQPPTSGVSLRQKLQTLASDGGSALSILGKALKQTIASFNPFGNSGEFAYPDQEHFEQVQNEFERLLGNFTSYAPLISFTRLTGSRLGAYLSKTVGMAAPSEDYPLGSEDSPVYSFLDEQLPHNDLKISQTDIRFMQWNSHNGHDSCLSAVQSVRGWRASDNKHMYSTEAAAEKGVDPGGSFPGMLDDLLKINGEMIVTLAVMPYLPSAAEKFAVSMRKFHRDRRLGVKALFFGAFDKDRLADAPVNSARDDAGKEANVVHGKASIGKMMLCKTWIGVTTLGKDRFEVEEGQKSVERAFAIHGFDTIVERMHALSCTIAHMPGNHSEIVRWIPVTANNVADICFARTLAAGSFESKLLTQELKTPCDAALVLPTSFNTSYFFDIFKPTVAHGLLVGPSRSGKTVFAMLLLSSFTRYPNAQVYCLDKDFSCRITVVTHGGSYANLDPDSNSEIKCNPYALMAHTKHHEWLKNFTMMLVQQHGYKCTTDDAIEIGEGIKIASRLEPTGSAFTLQDLYDHIVKKDLKRELSIWVNGSVARYFNNQEDGFKLNQINGFELGQILSNSTVAVPFMEMLFYRIDQHLRSQIEEGVICPTLIFIPEVYHLLSNPTYAPKLVDWLKTLAKRNCALWMDTQSLEDANEDMSKVFAAIRDNVLNIIFSSNRAAMSDSAKRLYMREFGLREEQVVMVAQGIPKEDYVLRQADIVRQVRLSLGQDELAMLRSEMTAQKAIVKYMAKNQPVEEWLDDYIQEVSHEKVKV